MVWPPLQITVEGITGCITMVENGHHIQPSVPLPDRCSPSVRVSPGAPTLREYPESPVASKEKSRFTPETASENVTVKSTLVAWWDRASG
jgi:hypothetical protein